LLIVVHLFCEVDFAELKLLPCVWN